MKTRILALVVSGIAVLGLTLWARYGLIEPEGIAHVCLGSEEWHCVLRDLIVATFNRQQLGYVAVGAAILALVPKLRPLAWLAWVSGLAGLVLYCWDYAAVGTVLALLVLARPANASSTHNTAQA
jgi:hypothetical protein